MGGRLGSDTIYLTLWENFQIHCTFKCAINQGFCIFGPSIIIIGRYDFNIAINYKRQLESGQDSAAFCGPNLRKSDHRKWKL